MELGSVVTIGGIAALAGLILWQSLRSGHDRVAAAEKSAQLAQIAQSLAQAQSQLAGRMAALSESQISAQSQLADRFQAQERAVTKTLEDRLGDMAKRVVEGLEGSAQKQSLTLHELRERLAVIDAAQANITQLSAQVVGLQDILSNKQARGAFGEIQLNDLVRSILPPSAYEFQATLGNGRRADCLLRLPNPPGAIVIDAKFPLESFHALRNAADDAAKTLASRSFGAAILTHVKDISERYILAGETAESALMFLPSEAVYAELHANFSEVVEKSYRAKVWIVSPTTLMATLNTVRAVLKDARMREQAGVIQKEVHLLIDDVERLDGRVANLSKHFDQAAEDIRQIRISATKVTNRGEKIQDIELGPDSPTEDLPTTPKQSLPAE